MRRTRDTITEVSLHMDRLVAEKPPEPRAAVQIHLVSVLGGDQDVGAIPAAVADEQRFQISLPGGAGLFGFPGRKASDVPGIAPDRRPEATGTAYGRSFADAFRNHTRSRRKPQLRPPDLGGLFHFRRDTRMTSSLEQFDRELHQIACAIRRTLRTLPGLAPPSAKPAPAVTPSSTGSLPPGWSSPVKTGPSSTACTNPSSPNTNPKANSKLNSSQISLIASGASAALAPSKPTPCSMLATCSPRTAHPVKASTASSLHGGYRTPAQPRLHPAPPAPG